MTVMLPHVVFFRQDGTIFLMVSALTIERIDLAEMNVDEVVGELLRKR
jgi:hypothetical protein